MKKVKELKIEKREIVQEVFYVDNIPFHSEQRALEYIQQREDYQIKDNLHKMKLKSGILSGIGDWVLIRNEAELDYFKRKAAHHHKSIFTFNRKSLSLGDWIAELYDVEEGENVFDGLITLEYVLNDMKKYIEQAEELTVEGKY